MHDALLLGGGGQGGDIGLGMGADGAQQQACNQCGSQHVSHGLVALE